jgi:hypothetical protein
MIMLLTLGACATWRQKDFKKEMEKSKEQEARVEVSEELREKFEIEPVKAVEPDSAKPIPTPTKQLPVKKVIKKIPEKIIKTSTQGAAKTAKLTPPKDYPVEFKSLNEKAKQVWDSYVPNHKQDKKVYLDIHYLGMTVGKIMFTNKGKRVINDKEVWHFHARFKSAPFYSKIYELDDTVDTYVTTDKFLSVRYSLVQRESKQDIDDLQLHDRDKLKTFWFYKQKKSDGTIREKKKEGFIPFFSTDPFSIIFLYEGLPLKSGDFLEIPVINKGKVLIVKSWVEGREVIETSIGRRKAIRIHATTKYTGEHLKDGDMYLWISDDPSRTLLKIKAKIKIGSVTADIVEG